MALPLCLAGCFSSDKDLLAGHELALARSASLVSLNGYPHRIDDTPQGQVVCELRLRTDTERDCWNRYSLKFERTVRGNILVQATGLDGKFLDEGKSAFLLVVRRPDEEEGCWYLLGAGNAPSNSPAEAAERAIAERYPDEQIDRPALLAIVDAYERTVLPADEECARGKLTIPAPRDLAFADEPTVAQPAP